MSAIREFVRVRLAEERELIGRYRQAWLRLTDPVLSGNTAPQPGDDDGLAFAALQLVGLNPFAWARAVDHQAAIVDRHQPDTAHDNAACAVCTREPWPCDEIKLWALRWRAHPAWRPEWTPQTTVVFHGETR